MNPTQNNAPPPQYPYPQNPYQQPPYPPQQLQPPPPQKPKNNFTPFIFPIISGVIIILAVLIVFLLLSSIPDPTQMGWSGIAALFFITGPLIIVTVSGAGGIIIILGIIGLILSLQPNTKYKTAGTILNILTIIIGSAPLIWLITI